MAICRVWRCLLSLDFLDRGCGIFCTDIEDLVIVLITWTSTGVVAVALSRKPSMTSPTQLVVWVKSQRKAIRPLLRDSVVMDVSATELHTRLCRL